MSNNRVLTIPNLLTASRIVLAVVFGFLYDVNLSLLENWPAVLVLVLNGLTDLLDGKLARALNQVTELGKILDPIADIITKIVILLCFTQKYPLIWGLLGILAVKQILVACVGYRAVRRCGYNNGSIFAGKADTVVFYLVMLVLALVPDLPLAAARGLLCLSGVMMLLALVLYMVHFSKLLRDAAE